MIEEEVKAILDKKSTSKQAILIGQLTDEFRSGRNSNDLLDLLHSEDSDVIWIGIYILGEILIDNKPTLDVIIERLLALVEHKDVKIRYGALINLSTFLKESAPRDARNLYLKMSSDNDEGVRKTAESLLKNGSLR